MKTILVPVDFSPVTDRVLAEASDLAGRFEARLILLHVTEPAVGLVDYAVVTLTIAQANDVAVQGALTRLTALQASLQARHAAVEIRNCIGMPVEEILTQAASLHADYIVIGSHGHGRIYDALVGSTTNGTLKNAPCPVLVVPPNLPPHTPEHDVDVTI